MQARLAKNVVPRLRTADSRKDDGCEFRSDLLDWSDPTGLFYEEEVYDHNRSL
jgi:hypothetical protein